MRSLFGLRASSINLRVFPRRAKDIGPVPVVLAFVGMDDRLWNRRLYCER